ncbi:tetratricopeptide repeat protein [Shouchella clausii]|uniref:Tetratrico peptide repeat group 5 domain-containing protein n=1 Tax=Shouchella clausii TaxID=79880 RepID=A0A268NZL0_SHOCL|nr:tetratricopeptide repeat protein [Shouchella clausii]PAE88924.1 hypothetical protein CHH72_11155 [Shouchella clausii]
MHPLAKKAFSLQAAGKLEASQETFAALLAEQPNDPLSHYYYASSLDRLGKERQAVPHYEQAIALGLSGDDLEGALLGLGSTYRVLGEYGKAEKTLSKGCSLFPNSKPLQVFLAMALYNNSKHSEAMEQLLYTIADTTNDTALKSYEKAIRFYADKLDTVWDQ